MKKYIGILGGNFFNKGAEAMTCIVVNELKKKFPDCEIVLFSVVESETAHVNARNYAIRIVSPRLMYEKKSVGDLLYYGLFDKANNGDGKTTEYLSDMELLVDISGYGLIYRSSADMRDFAKYIHNIWIASKYDIPMYLLPQSYGPIRAKSRVGQMILDMILQYFMKIPKKVYAREKVGYRLIKRYRKDVKYVPDMVLNYKHEIDLEKIYAKNIACEPAITHPRKCVVIMPNARNSENSKCDLKKLYRGAIELLLTKGFGIYILSHSQDDVSECIKIKKMFANDERVQLDVNKYKSFQLEKLISGFSFGIASRYHSVVHAYRSGVPCVVLGWAEKYEELLKMFKQENAFFDVRGTISDEQFLRELEHMALNYETEKEKITKRYQAMKYIDIYEDITGKM